MYHALVHFPAIDTARIDAFAAKYNPWPTLPPHFTLIYPVPEDVGEAELAAHVGNVLRGWRPFPIHIAGFHLSWDYWLFLTLQEGRKEMVRLHDALYDGPPAPYRIPDIEFVPHISLGLFARRPETYDPFAPEKLELDGEHYAAARREAEALNLDYHTVLDRLTLLRLNRDLSQIEPVREFALGG
ncbi:MAG: 2'-5' RNA ligase family protein [Anaerolineae bacterium]